MVNINSDDYSLVYHLRLGWGTLKQLYSVKFVVDFVVDCHCSKCSENNKCLSRGECINGYMGDNCMFAYAMKDLRKIDNFIHSSNRSLAKQVIFSTYIDRKPIL